MEEEVFLVLDFDTVCRFCLRSTGALSDLFTPDDRISVLNQIRALLNIKVNPSDGFPSKICHRCHFKVELAYEFREMVMKTHKVLSDNTMEAMLSAQSNDIESFNKDSFIEERQPVNSESDLIISASQKSMKLVHGQTFEKDFDDVKPSASNNTEENCISEDNLSFLLIKEDNEYTNEEHLEEAHKFVDTQQMDISRVTTKLKCNKVDQYPSLLTAKRRNQCLLCLEECGNKEVLKEHIKKHVEGTGLEPYYMFGERDLNCVLCDRKFSYRFNFIIHQREHLNLKPFVCQYSHCDMSYSSVYRLRNHLLVHADKKFPCSVCKMKFQRKSDLRAHEIIHMDEGRQFQCSICKLICKNRRTLRAHIRKHYKTPRFKCEMCSKAYIHRCELERHSHIHSTEKRFRCSMCTSAYYSRAALVRHEKTHSQINSSFKKYCPLKLCKDVVFDTRQDYKDHMENHTVVDYPFCCFVCNHGFLSRSSFTKHLSSCNKPPAKDPPIFVELVQLDDEEESNIDNVLCEHTNHNELLNE